MIQQYVLEKFKTENMVSERCENCEGTTSSIKIMETYDLFHHNIH